MKLLSKLASLMLILCLNQGLVKAMQPVERSVGRLKISIDPRMELLSTIQLLSNYPLVNRDLPYSKDVLTYFKSFSAHDAVAMTNLGLQLGFAYDAPVGFMLHLSQLPELETQITFSDYLLSRELNDYSAELEQYRKLIKQFAEISNFNDFWNKKIPFYNQILDMTIANMDERDLIKTMEDYYNETKDSYNIIIAPAFRGGYGHRITDTDGLINIYGCLSTNKLKDDISYLSGDNILYYVWHEFGHSFVNPLSKKHSDKVASLSKLLEPIKEQMARQAYSDWETVVNEHIIRAVHVRLVELNIGSQQANEMLRGELERHYIYIEPLIEKLKDFERQRDKNQITFSEFYPELLNVLDSLQK